jgi:hypothetical protein
MNIFRLLPLLAVVLCTALTNTACSEIGDYFSTIAAEGLFLGVDDPAVATGLGLDAELAAGATASTFLAQARSLDSISENLFSDADSVSITDGITSVELAALGNGLYNVNSNEAPELVYVIGRSYTLEVRDDGELYTAEMLAPPPPILGGVPDAQAGESHAAGTDLAVSLGQQFDNYLVVVVDGSGEITYSNQPETASDYIDWIGSDDVVASVTIPAAAFPAAGTGYIIAIAGVRRASDSAFDNFNPLISNLAMGSTAVSALVTAQ